MKLISMTDFVFEQYETRLTHEDFEEKVVNYANFIKQPLELGFFVPCDENGNVLEEPYFDGENDQYYNSKMEEYQKAKERVLFEGFELVSEFENHGCFSLLYNNDKRIFSLDDKIENLLEYKGIEFKLTKSAIKQLEL